VIFGFFIIYVKPHQKANLDHLENREILDHQGEWVHLDPLEHRDHLAKLEVRRV
jgi:hypothetical protein